MKTFLNGIALIIMGTAFGWLIGMAVSPVINTVITSLVALLVTLTAVLAGIKTEKTETDDKSEVKATRAAFLAALMQKKVSPWPVAILMVSIVFGAGLGLHVRTNGYLVPPAQTEEKIVNDEINMWVKLGMDSEYVVNTVYCSYYQLPMEVYFDEGAESTAPSQANSNGQSTPANSAATGNQPPKPGTQNSNAVVVDPDHSDPVVVTPGRPDPAITGNSGESSEGIKPNKPLRVVFPGHIPKAPPKNDSME